jgi:hypothetical protein
VQWLEAPDSRFSLARLMMEWRIKATARSCQLPEDGVRKKGVVLLTIVHHGAYLAVSMIVSSRNVLGVMYSIMILLFLLNSTRSLNYDNRLVRSSSQGNRFAGFVTKELCTKATSNLLAYNELQSCYVCDEHSSVCLAVRIIVLSQNIPRDTYSIMILLCSH